MEKPLQSVLVIITVEEAIQGMFVCIAITVQAGNKLVQILTELTPTII